MDIHLVTGNKDKLELAEHILGTKLKSIDLNLDEIQELDINKVAKHKALQAWEKLKKPLFVMDQSVHIHCLNGFPGPLIKWFWTQVTLDKICKIASYFGDKKISTETVIAYYNGKELKYFRGTANGTIPEEPRGDKGWGWDPIFIPEGHEKTYAEMDREEAAKIRSYLGALKEFKEFIEQKNA